MVETLGGKKGHKCHQGNVPYLSGSPAHPPRTCTTFETYLTLPSCVLHVFKHKSLKIGSLCIGFPFLLLFRFYVLLDHLDPEGDAAQVLIPLVVVAQV